MSLVVAQVMPRGVVRGIVYSANRPSVLIDGQVPHQGYMVNVTPIVKICPDLVEFGKNNQIWLQEVSHNPPR